MQTKMHTNIQPRFHCLITGTETQLWISCWAHGKPEQNNEKTNHCSSEDCSSSSWIIYVPAMLQLV